MPRRSELNARQRRFCEEYLIDLNGTQAVIRAGYSPNGADVAAAKLLVNARVAALVAELKEKRSKRTRVNQDRVLLEIERNAFSDIRKAFREDGGLKRIVDLDDDTAAAVASVEVDELFEGRGQDREQTGYTKKLKLWNKNDALEKLAKHLGLYPRETGVNLNLTYDQIKNMSDEELDEAMKRLERKSNTHV